MINQKVILAPDYAPETGFNFCQPDELVMLPFAAHCSTPECGRNEAFIGAESRKGTTIGIVADMWPVAVGRELRKSYDKIIELATEDELARYHRANVELHTAVHDLPIGAIVRRCGTGIALVSMSRRRRNDNVS